jgi:hypothetical protein
MAIDKDYDHRILAGLKFITKADRPIKKAIQELNKTFTGALPSLAIDPHHFDVATGGGATHRYHGKMTAGQYKALNTTANLKSLQKFADAVSKLVTQIDQATNAASDDLLKALKIQIEVAKYPPEGTCTYDNNMMAQCTQIACTEGLLGTWVPE